MNGIIVFSVRHPVSVLSAITALTLLGLLCAFIIPVDFLPEMSSRNLLVAAEYPGIPAEEMRSMVTMPLEDTFASLRGLKASSSVSRDGLALLSLELHWGTDIDMALTESRELIDLCYESLPSGCMKPQVLRNDSARMDDITLILIPLDGDLRYGRRIAETDIKPRLQRLSGTASVSLAGGEKEELHLRFHRAALESRGLSISDAAEILAAANFEYPAGTIREGERELGVKTSGLWKNTGEIKDTPLSYNEGGLIRAGDLADLVRESRKREAFFLYDGMEAIRIGIRKKAGASPLPLSAEVKREIEILKTLYGKWYAFEISANTADYITESLLSLLLSALASIFAAAAVVYLFFRSFKLSLLITGVIPLSTVFTVLALRLCGQSLNVMSLSGISIGIGMVIDAATVTVENIQRELETNAGETLESIIVRGVKATVRSNFASSFSTAIVFVPVFFIGGLLGELFTGMAIGVIASISVSCLLSFTYIPAVSVFLLGPLRGRTTNNPRLARLAERYETLLRFLLKKPAYTLPLALFLVIGGLSFVSIERRLLPELSSKTLSWEIDFPQGTGIEAIRRTAFEIYRDLSGEPWIGGMEISGGLEHDNYQSLALLDEKGEKLRVTARLSIDAEAGQEKIAALFAGSPYRLSFGGSQDILSGLLDLKGDLLILRAESPEEVRRRAEALAAATAELSFAPDIMGAGPVFSPDRLALSRFSVSARSIASTARNVLEGIEASSYYEEGREIPLLVKLRDEDIRSLEDLENTLVPAAETRLPLRFFGSFTEEKSEKALFRYNRRDAKELRGTLGSREGLDLVSPGKTDIDEMTRNAVFLLIVTALLLYLSMGAQFESLTVPLVLLAAIPPACSGAFLSLLLTGHSLDSNSVMALLILFGISINNSILLYEACAGQDTDMIAGNCAKKLRAILITNLTTIIALVPFAVDPLGINAQASLASAVIGGLIGSLVLVLAVVPLCFPAVLSGKRKA